MTDISITAIQAALSGLSIRQRAIADNVANINTPGYLATKTDFESSLQAALTGDGDTISSMVSKSLSPTRTDGNNVDLDTETLSAIETNLRYQAMIESLNAKFTQLKTAIGQ